MYAEEVWASCGSREEVAMLGPTCIARFCWSKGVGVLSVCQKWAMQRREKDNRSIQNPAPGIFCLRVRKPHDESQWQQELGGDWEQQISTSWESHKVTHVKGLVSPRPENVWSTTQPKTFLMYSFLPSSYSFYAQEGSETAIHPNFVRDKKQTGKIGRRPQLEQRRSNCKSNLEFGFTCWNGHFTFWTEDCLLTKSEQKSHGSARISV